MNKDNLINNGIYGIYGIIACVSVGVALQTSFIVAGIVLALEGVRMIAVYKKLYLAILIVLIGNICLIGYNSSKVQDLVEYNNNQVKFVNEKTKSTLDNTFQAKNVSNLSDNVKEIVNISIDWWFMVVSYLFLEITLLIVVMGINKQEKQVVKPKVKVKVPSIEKGTNKEELPVKTEAKLKYVGSYAEYYKTHGGSRSEAKKLFEQWKAEGRLVKQEGKNYLKI